MNAKELTFAHLIPFAIILLPVVTPVNVNQVLKEMVGLHQNKHQRVLKVPDVSTLTNAPKKSTTVMTTLQHVPILLAVLSVSAVLVTVVMDMSSLRVTKLSTKAVGIPTNVPQPLLKMQDEDVTLKALLQFHRIAVTSMPLVIILLAKKEDLHAHARLVLLVMDSHAKTSMNVKIMNTNVTIMQHVVTLMVHTHVSAMKVGLVTASTVKISMNVQLMTHHVFQVQNALILMVHTLASVMMASKVMAFVVVVSISTNVLAIMTAIMSVHVVIWSQDMNVYATKVMIIMMTMSATT